MNTNVVLIVPAADTDSVPKPWCYECMNNVKKPCTETCGHPHNKES